MTSCLLHQMTEPFQNGSSFKRLQENFFSREVLAKCIMVRHIFFESVSVTLNIYLSCVIESLSMQFYGKILSLVFKDRKRVSKIVGIHVFSKNLNNISANLD